MPSLANAIVVFKKRNTTKLKIAMPPILEKNYDTINNENTEMI